MADNAFIESGMFSVADCGIIQYTNRCYMAALENILCNSII